MISQVPRFGDALGKLEHARVPECGGVLPCLNKKRQLYRVYVVSKLLYNLSGLRLTETQMKQADSFHFRRLRSISNTHIPTMWGATAPASNPGVEQHSTWCLFHLATAVGIPHSWVLLNPSLGKTVMIATCRSILTQNTSSTELWQDLKCGYDSSNTEPQ